MRTSMIVGTIGLCVAAAAVGAQPAAVRVAVATAKLRELPVSVTLVGSVAPVTRSLIATEVAGIVERMPAREGDAVERGQLLCKLNDDAISLRLAEAKARLGGLEAELRELQAGERKTELQRLSALYESARAEFERWTFERERVRGLYGSEQSNQKEVYDTEASYRSAEQQMLAAKALYELGVEGPRSERIDRARFAATEQRAVVRRLERDLAKTEIKAPFSGYVVRRETEVGEWIAQGSGVVELVDLSRVLVQIDVPENAIPFVRVGDRATVRIDALQTRVEGTIRHVIPQADAAARTFPVEVEIVNDEGVLKSGMFARVTVVGGTEQQVVAVPKDAISWQMGSCYVAMIQPGEGGMTLAVPMPVTVGLDIGDWVEITSKNIPPGTRVVTRGNEMITLMRAPSPVEIMEETSPT